MKKIKIIELLDLIATYNDGEEYVELPKKIRFDDIIFKFDSCKVYLDEWRSALGEYITGDLSNLNDEVEIIEDENIEANGIKKLNLTGENQLKLKTNKQEYNIRVVDKIIINKINEIIDKEY